MYYNKVHTDIPVSLYDYVVVMLYKLRFVGTPSSRLDMGTNAYLGLKLNAITWSPGSRFISDMTQLYLSWLHATVIHVFIFQSFCFSFLIHC